MNIILNLYRTFLIVAQSKSYADASNKLNISKTAIGKNIQQLEEQLNTKLFYRESKGISLTADFFLMDKIQEVTSKINLIYLKEQFIK